MQTRKPLTDAQMGLIFLGVLIVGAYPLYLAWHGNPWPCIAVLVLSKGYLFFRRKQLKK